MPVPDYQTMMLPLLNWASSNEECSLQDAVEVIGNHFNLTSDERRERIRSGKGRKLYLRVSWAKSDLAKAGLLINTGRGRFCITERGLAVLAENPVRIDNAFLRRYSTEQDASNGDDLTKDGPPGQTPEEIMASLSESLRQALAQELLANIKRNSPKFFEQLVIDLLVAMGYGGSSEDAAQAVGHSGDEGIDGVIKEDRLGLDMIYVQAKRWDSTVGRSVIQAFAGSLEGQRAKKGVFITTSDFSSSAKEYVQRIERKIVLIDGQQLAELMIEHNIGVTEITRYEIKKIDSDYFSEE